MSIWNKILLVCIFLAAIALFVLSAKALHARRYWGKAYDQHKEAIAAAKQEIDELRNGTSSQRGLRKAKVQLYRLLIGRGRVWDNCMATDVYTDRQGLKLEIETADSVEAEAVVYAFEDKPAAEGGRYLGQFTVKQVAGTELGLVPSTKMSPEEYARLIESKDANTPWRLYELMPRDDHEVMRELSDDEITAMFPEVESDEEPAAVRDFLYDGKIITKQEADTKMLNGIVVIVDEGGNPIRNEEGMYTEVADNQAKGMFIRQLRDYELLLAEQHRLRAKRQAQIEMASQDVQDLNNALADAGDQKIFRQKERDALEQELAAVSQERDVVQAHEAALTGAISAMRNAIDQLIARNEATVARLAEIQTDLARAIRARTASVVQSASRQPAQP